MPAAFVRASRRMPALASLAATLTPANTAPVWSFTVPVIWPEVEDCARAGVVARLQTADAIKAIMTGADVAMMASALLRHGPEHVTAVEAGLRAWMEEHEYHSVSELRGSAAAHNVGDRSAYERANYQAVLHSWSTGPARESVPRA